MSAECSVSRLPRKAKRLPLTELIDLVKNNLRKVFVGRCLYKNSENVLLKTYLGNNMSNFPTVNVNIHFSPLIQEG